MNILGLIFSLLLIISYGFFTCWDKQTSSSRLRSSYVGHEKAYRKILNQYQSEVYKNLSRSTGAKKETAELEISSKKATQSAPKIEFNRECAKINLWPLIQEGKSGSPIIYELTAKMLRTFYPQLTDGSNRFEYHLLDALLKAAKKNPSNLEKIDFKDSELQKVYYKMLKGTKEWSLERGEGYPPLLDYIKTAPSSEKICLSHAHPDLITILFNPKIAKKLYGEIHAQDAPLLTQELIEHICFQMHEIAINPELIELLELGYPHHKELKKGFTGQDKKKTVFLRKNLSLPH